MGSTKPYARIQGRRGGYTVTPERDEDEWILEEQSGGEMLTKALNLREHEEKGHRRRAGNFQKGQSRFHLIQMTYIVKRSHLITPPWICF